MRERSSPTPAHVRPTVIQPAVGAHGSCWRRQATSVVSRDATPLTAADLSGDGPSTTTDPRGDGRSPQQDQN
jgi:hypothetical protein